MRCMDELHPLDQFVSITGVGDHLLPQKRIGRYCAVSTSTSGRYLCVYAEYARVTEQPTSIHSCVQIEHSKNKISQHQKIG